MAKEIELPDGSIAEFPDSMDDASIKEVLRKKFPATPAPRQPVGEVKPLTLAERAALKADEIMTRMGKEIPD